MNESQAATSPISQLIQKILPLLDCSTSADHFLCTVENFELNIQSLETRVENIQQEIDILITEQ